ncbi:hypothetical protein LOK49_LG10G02563 [Camellia lanceoleosa]|uniref:Uncharacterized protein n=1 Tax=Camellia lanceoleosa TaxID=1840588 RepID=A0ACC0GCS6_9ERIC|nr:hypothetical protein LOK49_LG10G02563 [Camellia lanceoleosa]
MKPSPEMEMKTDENGLCYKDCGVFVVCSGEDEKFLTLTEDYGLSVATTFDLHSLAPECGMIELRNAGLKNLAREELGKEIEKPQEDYDE